MNIVEAYTKFNNQNIILVSGFAGSNKTQIANFLADIFHFKLCNLSSFYYDKNDYDKSDNYVELKKGDKTFKVLNWENIYQSINWDKFNKYVNDFIHENKTGIIIVGFGFPFSLIKFKPNFQLQLNSQNNIW